MQDFNISEVLPDELHLLMSLMSHHRQDCSSFHIRVQYAGFFTKGNDQYHDVEMNLLHTL